MTKQTKTKTTKEGLAPVEASLDSVKDLVAEASVLEKALQSKKAQNLFLALEQFAAIDYESNQQSATAGEVFHRILALPLDTQKKLVWAMADSLGVDRPTYEREGAGRPTTGRNELAFVLYAKYPDMLVKDKGKDTRGAKQITDHVRRFLIKTGARTPRTPGTTDKKLPDRALKLSFIACWNIAENETERRTLVSLYLRLGVEPEKMDKWTERGLLRLAAGPLAATTIEAAAG